MITQMTQPVKRKYDVLLRDRGGVFQNRAKGFEIEDKKINFNFYKLKKKMNQNKISKNIKILIGSSLLLFLLLQKQSAEFTNVQKMLL